MKKMKKNKSIKSKMDRLSKNRICYRADSDEKK